MLARVHGQCGCAKISSVDASGSIALSVGQYSDGLPGAPGALSYASIEYIPAPLAASQRTKIRTLLRFNVISRLNGSCEAWRVDDLSRLAHKG